MKEQNCLLQSFAITPLANALILSGMTGHACSSIRFYYMCSECVCVCECVCDMYLVVQSDVSKVDIRGDA